MHQWELEETPWKGTGLHQRDWLWGNCLPDADQAFTPAIRGKFPVYKKKKDTLHCTADEYAVMEKLVLLKQQPHTWGNVRVGGCIRAWCLRPTDCSLRKGKAWDVCGRNAGCITSRGLLEYRAASDRNGWWCTCPSSIFL